MYILLYTKSGPDKYHFKLIIACLKQLILLQYGVVISLLTFRSIIRVNCKELLFKHLKYIP
jgi:hypothetical protein